MIDDKLRNMDHSFNIYKRLLLKFESKERKMKMTNSIQGQVILESML